MALVDEHLNNLAERDKSRRKLISAFSTKQALKNWEQTDVTANKRKKKTSSIYRQHNNTKIQERQLHLQGNLIVGQVWAYLIV